MPLCVYQLSKVSRISKIPSYASHYLALIGFYGSDASFR